MALLHYGWWHMHHEPSDEEGCLRQFEKALEADPFNVRLVEAVMLFARRNAPDLYAELVPRLEQIVPETAMERSERKEAFPLRLLNRMRAFAETGDVSLMDGVETVLLPSSRNGFTHSHLYSNCETLYWLYSGDVDKLKKTAEEFPIPTPSSNLQCNGEVLDLLGAYVITMFALRQEERTSESEAFAKRILALQNNSYIAEKEIAKPLFLCALSNANFVLGETEAAKRFARQVEALAKEESEIPNWFIVSNTILAWSPLDSERAASLFLESLADENSSDLLGEVAIVHQLSRDTLTHPQVKAAIEKDGRWLDYLSERVPEYAGHAN